MTNVTTLKTVDDVKDNNAANDADKAAEESRQDEQESMDVTALMDMLKGREGTKKKRSRRNQKFSLGIKALEIERKGKPGKKKEDITSEVPVRMETMPAPTIENESFPIFTGERNADYDEEEEQPYADIFRESLPLVLFGVLIIAAFVGMLYFVDRQPVRMVEVPVVDEELVLPEMLPEEDIPAQKGAATGRQLPATAATQKELKDITPAAGSNAATDSDGELIDILTAQ